MKNVTITLDEEVARWARIQAAKADTSISRLVGELLRRHMEEEESYEASMKQFFSRKPTPLKRKGRYPKRDDLHDRAGLR